MDVGTSETRPGSSSSCRIDAGGFSPGTILADRYRIVASLGRGGMGEVYRADDLRLGQPVALKFLPATLERDPAARERLLAEVRNARTISHPNVCRVYDIGELAGLALDERGESRGRLFLTMEYIDGEDLASLLRRIGRLPAPKALEVARQLCAGLAAAHDKGVLHRDLKPANVMIDGRGQARIADFGLAVEATREAVAEEFAGSVAYMAPERFRGLPATAQSDLYALGLVLYETFTGKAAFHATTLGEWQRAHRDSTPTTPSLHVSDIDPAVERAILCCIEKDPARRPTSAAQLAARLPGGDPLAAAVAAGETPSPELVAASGEAGTLSRARAWLSFASCLAAVAIAALLIAPVNLINIVPQPHGPDWLQTRAREILERLGYARGPADRAWSWSVESRPGIRGFGIAGRSNFPALSFVYRESPAALVPRTTTGSIQLADPAPLWPDEAQLVLDPEGRLRFLQVGGLLSQTEERTGSPPAPDWKPLLDAAGLSGVVLEPAPPVWLPAFYADTRAAWTGRSDGETFRAEAAARWGVPVQFRLAPSDWRPEQRPPSGPAWLRAVYDVYFGAILGIIAVLAVLARHNIRLARGDRRGALKCALFVFACLMVRQTLSWHWNPEPLLLQQGVMRLLGFPTLFAVGTWLLYIGLEPYTRRRWPHLLIAWARLLDGRWRDGLVGQSLMIGVAAGAAQGICTGAAAMAGWLLKIPGAVPIYHEAWANAAFWLGLPGYCCCLWLAGLGWLLVGRLAFRRDGAAWAVLAALATSAWVLALYEMWLPAGMALVVAAADVAIALLVLRHAGLLAVVVTTSVAAMLHTAPLTLALSRWYAGRGLLEVAVIAGFAFWGFRNALGRQRAFPSRALDALLERNEPS